MDWIEWEPLYLDIVSKLSLDIGFDRTATNILTEMLRNCDPDPLLQQLKNRISGRDVIVFGAGPSLDRHIQLVLSGRGYRGSVHIAADGAVRALHKYGMHCDFLVTDLDGVGDDIAAYTKNDTLPVVHAHGDNITLLKRVLPSIGQVLGSTQVEPTNRAFLWGGFTDGDRACYMASEYRPKRIIVAGMDFGRIVGRWSKPEYPKEHPADERKAAKLDIGQALLTRLTSRSDLPFLFLR